jgi:hypothetical protein
MTGLLRKIAHRLLAAYVDRGAANRYWRSHNVVSTTGAAIFKLAAPGICVQPRLFATLPSRVSSASFA